MTQLVQKLDAGRRVYLLEGPDAEQLFLAAEYIGTWHRLKNAADECYAAVDDEDEDPDNAFGLVDSLSGLPRLVENMRSRALIIVLSACPRPDQERKTKPEFFSFGATMEDVSFELETDCIRLGAPNQESLYKREVLRQLARKKGAPLAPKASAEKILSLVEEHRGNVSNRTIAKAVSNALLRRKTQGPLRDRDFDYLASVFPAQRKQRQENAPELVGQLEVRRRLTHVVDSMTFQKRRKAQGLPCSPIHYTFAFLGAPGTGKTSWARWLAREMETRGLLSGSYAICINAAELKAKYVGHTTGKVKALFEQYNVIILDEAYSLAEGEGEGAAAEILEEYRALERDGGRAIGFSGGGTSLRG